MGDLISAIKTILRDVAAFCEHGSGLKLRSYQEQVARAIVDSVINRRSLNIVVMFPRQSGKNELQAQIECYLLVLFSQLEAEMVKVSPTWKPQSLNAMRRLQRVLGRNFLTSASWKKEQGYVYRHHTARITFLSGAAETNVVGATASLLLECDEAQDVLTGKWDKDFAPMAASTNATRVFWGTAWTSRTLLGRELRAALKAEQRDGVRRAFVLTAEEVAREVPAYGEFVKGQIARLGRNHPLVKTQFFSEEIDAEGGMFPPERLSLMRSGDHEYLETPRKDCIYALLIDVAGEDESAALEDGSTKLANQGRDSTALTIVEVDLATLQDELIKAPTYRVVHRRLWTGIKHSVLYGQLKAIADLWQPRYLAIDATGVGAGIASFLEKAFSGKVLPYIFTSRSKSDLGWGFLAVIESGRYKEYARSKHPNAYQTQAIFFKQLEACRHTILDGPGKLMRWGVPDGTRDPESGEALHDDLALSAALCAALDGQSWGMAHSAVLQAQDPLADLKEVF